MVPSPIRPVLGVLAAVTLSAGFGVVPQAHAQVPAAAPVAPLDRDGEISRDDSRPALLPEVARRIIRGHLAENIVFGTDYPITTQKEELERLFALRLTDAENERILQTNAESLLGL